MVAGCGGGSSSGSAASATTNAAATSTPAKTVVIDAEGDSTMYGFQTSNNFTTYWQTASNPPALLQASLQAQYGTTVTVENHGHPGATLGNLMNATFGFTESYAQEVVADKAQLVIENYAINDSNPANSYAETPEQFENYLLQFIADSQAAGRSVVLEEPNPVVDATINANLKNLVAVIDDVAAQMNLPLVKQYYYIESLTDWQSMLIDGVHPTDALYKIKAEREAAVVSPIVATLVH